MHYYIDTEFHQFQGNVTFMSVGIVAGDGRELHLVSSEFDPAGLHWWTRKNVWKKFAFEPRFPLAVIRKKVLRFLDDSPEFVGFGTSTDEPLLRELLPDVTPPILDLEPMWRMFGQPALPKRDIKHHALYDARWCRSVDEQLSQAA